MAVSQESFSFDDQAGAFERRAGIPPEAAISAARDLADALLPTGTDVLLDIGAGSGELGRHLAQAAPRYLGFDLSFPMLAEFQSKRSRLPFPLVQADADAHWPVRGGSVRAVLFSRSAHLMNLTHQLRELWRVAHPGGAWVIIGRVERDAMSMRSQLRDQMLALLDEHAPRPRRAAATIERSGAGDGRGRARGMKRRLERALVELGAQVEAARVAGRWVVEDSLTGILDDWRSKSGLGGRDLDSGIKSEVLRALETWGAARFGTLSGSKETCERRFEWTPIRLPLPLPPLPQPTNVQAPSQ